MKYTSASAPAKAILFGEHAVVYGISAIAMAISLRSKCKIEALNHGIELDLPDYNLRLKYNDLNQLRYQIPNNLKQIALILEVVHDRYNIESFNFKASLTSEILPGSGLGSSASVAAAIITALSSYYDLGFKKKVISNLAFKMEEITHGTPSGVDSTVCTFGNLITFQKGRFHYIEALRRFSLLITYSNIEHNTKQAVSNVRTFKEEYPSSAKEIFDRINDITKKARRFLKTGKLQELGTLMNLNQELLERLSLSNDSISEIIKIGLDNGAYGSKITGAGLGGCVITLANDEILNQISVKLEKKGYKSFIVQLDTEGAKIEE